MRLIECPRRVVKLDRMISGLWEVGVPWPVISDESLMLEMRKCAVGPYGRCIMVMVSGSLFSSWMTMRSVKFRMLANLMISCILYPLRA